LLRDLGHMWCAVNVDSGELIALEASYERSCLNALIFLKKALKLCINRPMIVVDGDPRHGWALEARAQIRCQRSGIRNRVKRFFRYLKEKVAIFHHKLSAKNHIQGIENLNLSLKLFAPYYQTIKMGGGE